MYSSTLARCRCPQQSCLGELKLARATPEPSTKSSDILWGEIHCLKCDSRYPILAGVAILVPDVGAYLMGHVKGISKLVPIDRIPEIYRDDYLEAFDQIEPEHIEEDLEAERVTALYAMNHYLSAKDALESGEIWWRPAHAPSSPLIDQLVREHWDQGPFGVIREWLGWGAPDSGARDVVELGCGVGGLLARLSDRIGAYLGVDTSFASVAIGRHLALGAEYTGEIRVPQDLLAGPVSALLSRYREKSRSPKIAADLIVGDLDSLPVERGTWGCSIALNAIDMMPLPELLPVLQKELLREGGEAIQSCPYVWHEAVARELRGKLPGIEDSAQAVEELYRRAGLEIRERAEHQPWLFFKHYRQLEIYSVHLFKAVIA